DIEHNVVHVNAQGIHINATTGSTAVTIASNTITNGPNDAHMANAAGIFLEGNTSATFGTGLAGNSMSSGDIGLLVSGSGVTLPSLGTLSLRVHALHHINLVHC